MHLLDPSWIGKLVAIATLAVIFGLLWLSPRETRHLQELFSRLGPRIVASRNHAAALTPVCAPGQGREEASRR